MSTENYMLLSISDQ